MPPARRATILASVPWFLQDLGTYCIGIFTPTILARTFGHEISEWRFRIETTGVSLEEIGR